MTCGLVHASYSLPEWQAVKLTFSAPCRLTYIFGNFSVTSWHDVSEPSSIIANLNGRKKVTTITVYNNIVANIGKFIPISERLIGYFSVVSTPIFQLTVSCIHKNLHCATLI